MALASADTLKEQWSDEVCTAQTNKLEPDAQYAMEDCKVPVQIQAKLAFTGFSR